MSAPKSGDPYYDMKRKPSLPPRWKAVAFYSTEIGEVDVQYEFEELDMLHDVIEAGPDWRSLIKIEVRRSDPETMTIAECDFGQRSMTPTQREKWVSICYGVQIFDPDYVIATIAGKRLTKKDFGTLKSLLESKEVEHLLEKET